MTPNSLQSQVLAIVGCLVVLLMTSCASGSGSSLRPAATARTSIHLDTGMMVDTGLADGRVYLPSGTYRAIGENEKGIFYASPTGVGTHVQLTTIDLFTVANGSLGTTVPGGVCVAKLPLGAEEVMSYATWRAAVETPEVPAALSLARPEVRFTVVR